MAKLAIKGHAKRGSEVIELLEMFGGINSHNLYGDESYAYYTIDSDKEIKGGIYVFGDEDLSSFTLEEFEEKFPYKVGDKILYKVYGIYSKIKSMLWNKEKEQVFYRLESNKLFVATVDELNQYKVETMKQIKIDIPKGYEFFGIDDDNKIVLAEKQPQYPKTYKECFNICFGNKHHIVQVLGLDGLGGNKDLFERFIKLKICRDAYWKIAGEQMGLGKPWKPDWCDDNKLKYCIKCSYGTPDKTLSTVNNYFLAFPTEEMRDTFYNNFKELIEQCKELL